MHYLERYSSSSTNLRRVLMRRIHRSIAHWGDDLETAIGCLDLVLSKLTRLGYLDDSRYALARAGVLRARGGSTLKVKAGLAAKGVNKELIDMALSQLAERGDGGDLEAAFVYARKRRLGPYRISGRDEFRDRDLAALGRAGFSWAVAKRVVDTRQDEFY